MVRRSEIDRGAVRVEEFSGTPTRMPDARVFGVAVTTVGEIMLILGFLAAGLVLADPSGPPAWSFERSGAMLAIAALGLLCSIGIAGGGRGLLANWGANLSLFALLLLGAQLLLTAQAGTGSGKLTPFLSGALLLMVVRTLLVNVRLILQQFRAERERPEPTGEIAILRGRWVVTLLMVLLVTLAAG